MGKYFNPGNEKFREHRQQEIYIDKSGMLVTTNDDFCSSFSKICVDRPHRFGKTYDADMMVAYYSRGCDSEPLFRDLEIAKSPDFKKHLNKYDVIYIDVSDLIHGYGKDVSVTKIISDLATEIIREMKDEYPKELKGYFYQDDMLSLYLHYLFDKTNIRIVFIIDNYDAFYRERDNDEDGRAFNSYLNSIIKGEAYVGMTYMTGVLSIKQYPLSTAMDMFEETYMTRADFWKEYMGFTEKQVKELCKKYGKNYDKIREWYGGYVVEDVPLFNPDSVVKAMLSPSQDFVDYWTDVAPDEDLDRYLELDFKGLKDAIDKLVDGETVDANLFWRKLDITTFYNANDVLNLLVYLGYLTCVSSGLEIVKIPNREMREQFLKSRQNSQSKKREKANRKDFGLKK